MELGDRKVIPLVGPGSKKRRKRPKADDNLERAGPCPVQALGHDTGLYFYVTPAGQMRELSAGQHRESQLDALFDGDVTWPNAAFTKFTSYGDAAGYKEGDLRRYLMRQCVAQGFFDPARALRGPGVWRDDFDGLIVHAGNKLLVGGKWFEAGKKIGDFIYPAGPGETRPASTPATVEDVADLQDLLASWAWISPKEAPMLLLGFLGQSYICGALDWRSHLWITGDKFTGKSWQANLIHALLGTLVLHASEATPAGVRQQLAGAARPVVLDEMEPDPSNSRSREIVARARLGSTEGQGPVLRGSSEGRARKWPIRACFYFSSILYPPFLPQDAGRICVLELGKLGADTAADQVVQKRGKLLGKKGPRFYARMIEGWPRLASNLEVFEAAIVALGRRSRVRVQVGTLLACAHTLLRDDPVPLRDAVEYVGQMDLAAVADKHPEEDSELCLNWLYSAAPPDWRGGRRVTIGELLEGALEWDSESQAGLKAIGLKLIGDDFKDWKGQPSRAVWLAVAHHHQGLEQVFRDTRWAAGVWVQPIKRVVSAKLAGKPLNFGGVRARAVLIHFRVVKDGRPIEDVE